MTEYEGRLGVQYARECFEVRGTNVYWRDRPVRHFASEHAWKVFQTKYAGKPAGRKEHSGYIAIHMRYQGARIQLQAHRVIWMMHHGKWPERVIDHINRIRDDNRIENMRDVPIAENTRNAANKRVHLYVFPNKSRVGSFAAQTSIGGQKVVHLGVFDTEAEAVGHRDMVNSELEKLARSLAKRSPIGRRRRRA